MNSNHFQSLPSSDEIHEILVRRVDQQKQAVGIVIGVLEPVGRRVIAYGSLAKDDPRILDGDTIFEIGSVTKVFTSLLLADMVNRREVALDEPAAKYLPVKMPERNGKAISLLDLASHSSGLPAGPTNRKVDPQNPFADDYSVEDLYQFLSDYTLPRDPGSEFEYSNLGAGLLGHLMALRAGTDYGSLVQSRITQVLGMADTGIALAPLQMPRLATGHRGMLQPSSSVKMSTLAGAGALRSSVNDMLTLLEAFLGYKESPLAPAMKAMRDVRRPAGKVEISLGWLVMSKEGQELVLHDGRTPGFSSFAGYDARARTGVVVLSNAALDVTDLGLHLLNPSSPLANPEPPKQRTEIAIDPKLLDRYTGGYQVTAGLTMQITREGDRLSAQGFASVDGKVIALPKFELFAESENKFFAKVADNQFTFENGPDGQVTRLILHRAGKEMPAPRLP